MKKVNLFPLVVFILISIVFTSCGPHVMLKSGERKLSYMRAEKSICLVFDYSNMSVGEYEKEESYVSKKVEKKNKKEPGSGNDWKEKWYGQRKSIFEPKFETLINKYVNEKNLYISRDNKNTNYTIIVQVTFMEPGFNIGIMSKPAEINTKIMFVKSDKSDNPISVFEINKIRGRDVAGYDFAVSARLAESYAKCGKMLGKYIINNL